MRRLPPLNQVRAFEAAARHGSFKTAADELFVTPAAVSHQVKALEEMLGIELFHRHARGLLLTEDGRRYLPDLTRSLDNIAAATEQLRVRGISGQIRVSMLPSFGLNWFIPRLPKLKALHPDLDVVVDASVSSATFRGDGIDVALRYGLGRYPGLHTEMFLEEETYPVCSPEVARDIKVPADLRRVPLLHDRWARPDEPWVTWQPWLERFGIDANGDVRGTQFSDSSMMYEAARLGLGVAIGRSALVERDLESGRLVRPFPDVCPADFRYYLVCLPGWEDQPRIRAFRDWLMDEVKRQ